MNEWMGYLINEWMRYLKNEWEIKKMNGIFKKWMGYF